MKKEFRKLSVLLAVSMVLTTAPVCIYGDTPSANNTGEVVSGTDDEAVSDNRLSESDVSNGETVSENETVSDNDTVSENETVSDNDTVSENEALSGNEAGTVSADSVSDDAVFGGFGTIDMTMDFEPEVVAAVASATEKKKEEIAEEAKEAGIAGVYSVNALGSSNLETYENGYVVAPRDENENWDWAYAAAGLAEISMARKGITEKGHALSTEQIVKSTYNVNRHDLYGETWNRTTNTTEFNREALKRSDYTKIGEDGKTRINDVRYQVDYTAYIGDSKKDYELKDYKGNLITTVFDMERWGAPNSSGDASGYEGNYDQVDGELENALWVPNTDKESVKALIRDYGAAAIQIRIDGVDDTDFGTGGEHKVITRPEPLKGPVPEIKGNGETGSYGFKYRKITGDYKVNHTVVLIGWDDSIPAINFKNPYAGDQQPKDPGAFLVKDMRKVNGGYYWLSYEDAAFSRSDSDSNAFRYAVALDFAKNTKNDYNYGYDGTNRFTTFETKKVYGIFKSNHTELTSSRRVEVLNSVGVGVQDAGKYILTVYSGYDPSADKQYLNQYEVTTTTVDIPYPGFHSISLPDPILFYKNDVISVCLTREDGGLFNMLVDGFPDKDGYTSMKKNAAYPLGEISQISENGVLYNAYTHYGRERVEGYFTVPANGGSVLSGNKVPVPGATGDYMMLTPRMRLYTSDIPMPQDVDQNMLEIKLKKYVWLYTGNNINPFPRLLINFDATEDGAVIDRAGHEYHQALVMYNKLNNQNVHYDLTYANHKEAGIAAVIVRGKGDIFSGEISAPFKIEKEAVRIDKCKILGLEPQNYKYQKGTTLNSLYGEIKDNIIVKYYIKETKHYITLTEGVDYKIGSIEGENAYGKKLSVMITGIDTFKNTAKPKFKIRKQKELKPISDATVSVNLKYTDSDGNTTVWGDSELPEIRYTGKKINMEVDSVLEITDPETGEFVPLVKGVDYDAKIKLKNNKNAGMASVIIKAKKGSRFSGKLTRYFLITPKHVTTDATVKFKSTYKYTGKPIKAKPTVTLYGKKMSQGDLYVCYYNNTGSSSGTAKATGIVFGKGRYQGYIGYSTFTIDSSGYKSSSSSRSSSRSSSSR